jgi:hypothetical protein
MVRGEVMDEVEFLKEQAARFREFADREADPVKREALLDLARRCERLIEIIEGRTPDASEDDIP